MCRRPDITALLTVFVALASAAVQVRAAVIDGAPGAAAGTSPGGSAHAPQAPQAPHAPRYHLRCWQNGRLLFEQAVASLPADAGRSSTRLQSKDGAQEPVIVYETRNATCMARSLRAAR